jgi:hypothetical protein
MSAIHGTTIWANINITCHWEYLTDNWLVTLYFVCVSSGQLQAIGISNIKAITIILRKKVRVELKNILLVPSFSKNLISNHQGYGHRHKQSAVFKNRGATVVQGNLQGAHPGS